MLEWVLHTPLTWNAKQLTDFYLKSFSKQAVEIGILSPMIPRNMFKLHPKNHTR